MGKTIRPNIKEWILNSWLYSKYHEVWFYLKDWDKYLKFYLLYSLRFFYPVKETQFLYMSSLGEYYGCNPKYIYREAVKIPSSSHVWAFKKGFVPSDLDEINKYVILYSWQYYYYVITSKYLITNFHYNPNLLPIKGKNQVVLETWHGTALKRIGLDKNEVDRWSGFNWKIFNSTQRKIDFLISGSKYMTGIYSNCFKVEGKLYETGTPRNDIFWREDNNVTMKVKEAFNIPSSARIILYAPTFRDKDSLSKYTIDLKGIIDILEKRTTEKWVAMTRLHYFLLTGNNEKKVREMFPDAVDASRYPDMQELLFSADILITDYSSSMFDFMYSDKPCFLYAVDIPTYERGYYFDIHKLPFPIAENNGELKEILSNFNKNDYRQDIHKFISDIGSVEDGHAAERVVQLLIKRSAFS